MVLAALVVMDAALVTTFAAFVLVGAALVIALAGLTALSLAAVLGVHVHAGLAVVHGAGGVLAGALVVALVLADHGVGDIAANDFFGSVVVAGGHAESKGSSDKSG